MGEGVNTFTKLDTLDSVKNDPRGRLATNSGDHVHPNDAGYRAMAYAIDLSLFEEK